MSTNSQPFVLTDRSAKKAQERVCTHLSSVWSQTNCVYPTQWLRVFAYRPPAGNNLSNDITAYFLTRQTHQALLYFSMFYVDNCHTEATIHTTRVPLFKLDCNIGHCSYQFVALRQRIIWYECAFLTSQPAQSYWQRPDHNILPVANFWQHLAHCSYLSNIIESDYFFKVLSSWNKSHLRCM